MILGALLLLAASARADAPQEAVDRVLAKAEKLIAAEKGKDAREIGERDRKAELLAAELTPLGWKAAPALAAAAGDARRPPKVRLLAVSFLGLIRDPAAFASLSDILADPEFEPDARAVAAQSLPGQGVPDATVSAALCAPLAEKDLPPAILVELVIPLERLGCADGALLAKVARAFGPRPTGAELRLTRSALAGLGRSRGAASVKALLTLIAYYPPRSEARTAAITALEPRRADAANWLTPEALPVVTEALRSETERWDTMLPLIKLATALGPEAGPALARLALHPDAEVLADAADAIVLFKRFEALPDLEAVVAGAMSDPRFSPKDGRPDPAVLLGRIEKAASALRLARPN